MRENAKESAEMVDQLKEATSFCRRPFTELSIEPDGTLSPCCLIFKPANNNDFKERTLEAYLSSPALKQLQNALMNNERPSACEVCWNNEKAGIESMRAPEPSKYKIEDKKFREIHIKISSVCNFKCRMCGPFNSSTWLAEQRRNEPSTQEFISMFPGTQIQYALNDAEFRKDLFETIIPNSQLIRISGGEPLLCSDSLRFFQELVVRGLGNKQILVYTNLSKLSFGGIEYLEFWKQLPKLKLLVSCDGAGQAAEYSRTGLKWDTFLANVALAKSRIHSINCVINIYSVYSIPILFRFCQENQIKLHLGSVFRKKMSLQILPPKVKLEIKAYYEKFIESETGKAPAAELDHVYKSVINHMMSEDLSGTDEAPRFKRINDELDRRRQTDFSETFPQLREWYNSL